jgi:hypothetical protein
MTFSNVLIANNTFAGWSAQYLSVAQRLTDVTTLKLRNWTVANNLFVTDGNISQVDLGAYNYSSSDVMFDWNIVGNGMVNYMTTISNLAGLSAIGYTHNTASVPAFAGYLDFHTLSATSGTNLSSFVTIAPGILYNLDGTSRSGGFPIGAYGTGPVGTFPDPSLVLWYRFDSLTGFIHDDSGHHATGTLEDAAHWPVLSRGPTTNPPNAALFTHIAVDGTVAGDGQYAAVTWLADLSPLTNATIAVWAHYTTSIDANYINDQTATILSCDPNIPGTVGAWYLGRNFSSSTIFAAYTNASNFQATYLVGFPDSTASGDTGGWHHYAVTKNGFTFVGYFDGVPVATNSAPVDALRIGGNPPWLDIGSWPHNGTPAYGDDEYPNNGWMNGAIADVRIYNRRLSGADIQALVAGGPVTVGRPTGPSQLRVVSAP